MGRSDHPRSNVPFAAASSVQEFVVEAPKLSTSVSASASPSASVATRTGEKTASEIAQIFARGSNHELFTKDEQEHRDGDHGANDDGDSESSNSDDVFTAYDEGRDFPEIDFSSGKSIDQFDMSKSRTSDRNHAGWKEDNPTNRRIPVSSIDFEFDAKERSPKMIDSNKDKSINVNGDVIVDNEKPGSNAKEAQNVTAEVPKSSGNEPTPKIENTTEKTSSPEENSDFGQKIDTSLFDLSDDNYDSDAMTWRPLRLTPNGVFKTDVSEVISTSTGNGETIVTVLSSDSWIPNAGPIMKERD